jgi:D-glycero-D-manno-heptose 1,7-bisphosphate phosphatase
LKQKAIFLDRDGILNVERGEHTWRLDDFILVDGIVDLLSRLKQEGFLLIVITNQSGIAKGMYTRADMWACHEKFQKEAGGLIDDFYYAPGHPDVSESLSRKPDTLMFERAMAKHDIDPELSWMIGDKERDITPAKKLGIRTIRVMIGEEDTQADVVVASVSELRDIEF